MAIVVMMGGCRTLRRKSTPIDGACLIHMPKKTSLSSPPEEETSDCST